MSRSLERRGGGEGWGGVGRGRREQFTREDRGQQEEGENDKRTDPEMV